MGDLAIAALAPRPGERILDIGCGSGATSRALMALVAPNGSVTGVDISAPLLAAARAGGGGPKFLLADAGSEPIAGAPFDAAFSRFGVMFFEQPPEAFAHLRTQIKRSGRLAFVCWRSLAENPWMRLPMEAVAPLLRTPPVAADPAAPGPFAFADRTRVERVLAAGGWNDVTIVGHDTSYRLAADPEQATVIVLRIGMLGRLIREQGLDPTPFRQTLIDLMARHAGPQGVSMPAAVWFVSARA